MFGFQLRLQTGQIRIYKNDEFCVKYMNRLGRTGEMNERIPTDILQEQIGLVQVRGVDGTPDGEATRLRDKTIGECLDYFRPVVRVRFRSHSSEQHFEQFGVAYVLVFKYYRLQKIRSFTAL